MTEKKQIFTAEEWAKRQQEGGPWPRRRNHSLHRGGTVDLYTSAAGAVVAVLRFAELSEKIAAEVAPLIAAEEARAKEVPVGRGANPVNPPSVTE